LTRRLKDSISVLVLMTAVIVIMILISTGTAHAAAKGKISAYGGLRLRSGAGTSYRILTVIPDGTTITLKSKTGNWYKTSYSGKAGYVSASYVKKLSSSSSTTSTTSRTGYVKASGGLNLRKGAGTSYGVICVIPNGSAVTVKSSSGSWYKVVYNGKTGYVSSSYISWSKTSTSTLVRRSSSLPSASTVISKAVSWAVATANDDSHGYSLLASRRWGNPDYDCSTFVASAYRAAGLSLTYGGSSSVMYCGIMKTIFTADGFEWIPWSRIGGVSNLKAGDVLLDASAHTELYIGSGKTAAAHSDRGYPQAGDQTGTEVSVAGYYNNVGGVSWDGVLRYVG
jgi:uncharacterized protein YraI